MTAVPYDFSGLADANIYSSSVFNWQFYLEANPDLGKAGLTTEAQARAHWRDSGRREGRQATSGFSVKRYLAKYADLRDAYGTNFTAAIDHYLTQGLGEGRTG